MTWHASHLLQIGRLVLQSLILAKNAPDIIDDVDFTKSAM